MIEFFIKVYASTTDLLLDSSIYILGGLFFSGLLSLCLSPEAISKHLGQGRFSSVLKAALLGIPLPLCSCGVLPAAVSLKKQGANSGATAAFLISTPESGVDSIAVSYALLDPLLTIARPVAAFFMAISAGVIENIFHYSKNKQSLTRLPIVASAGACCAGCCSLDTGQDNGLIQKVFSAMVYAFTDVWDDLAGWFFAGLLIAGFITALIPDELISRFLGGGPASMLLMLLIGIPLYICATASTPVAAALIMKGVSPGAALVFLLAGPATNITSLTVLTGILGKKTLIIYLTTIALFSVAFGLVIDQIYILMNISPQAIIGKASEMLPPWLQFAGAVILVLISVKPFCRIITVWINKNFSHT
ncbi:MAG: SO_0444 family Cu/Zn efflux transporter [Desulfosarcina sp.]|nr:SO_0444 family Cu/Zn efflux transporter [Desulfobacterales bacterium]